MAFISSWKNRFLYVAEFTGVVTLDEIMACDHFFEGSENLDNAKATLWDFSAVDDIDIDGDEIKIIATLDKTISSHNEKLTLLIVVREEHFPIAELYKSKVTDLDWDVKILSSRTKADSIVSGILSPK